MKAVYSLVMAAAMLASSAFAADKNACVEGFKTANAAYFGELSSLQLQQTGGQVAQGTAVVGGLICILARRTIGGFFVCTVGAAAVGGGGYVVQNLAEQGEVSLHAKYQMDDSFLIYQAYLAGKNGVAAKSADVEILVRALGVTGLTPEVATAALAEAMESGDLCDENGTPAVMYPEMIDLVKVKL